jgi:hypothetical protein
LFISPPEKDRQTYNISIHSFLWSYFEICKFPAHPALCFRWTDSPVRMLFSQVQNPGDSP